MLQIRVPLMLLLCIDGIVAFSPSSSLRLARFMPAQHQTVCMIRGLRKSSKGMVRAMAENEEEFPLSKEMEEIKERSNTVGLSEAATWHRLRRKAILEAHPEIQKLERRDPSGVFILLLANTVLMLTAWYCASLPVPAILFLGATVGGTFSLWQLTTLHEVIHGTCIRANSRAQAALMWFASLPCVFGYYLYLQFGHLTHHNRFGAHHMAELFDSPETNFQDGDVLHVTHRMRLQGPVGPMPPPALAGRVVPAGEPMSVGLAAFRRLWRDGQPLRNMLVYTCSLCLERLVLIVSDRVVAATGSAPFFARRAPDFVAAAVGHARLQTAFQLAVLAAAGWKPLLFLFVAEIAWAVPVHPACAMYVTNHGSSTLPAQRSAAGLAVRGLGANGDCQPSKSTYIGKWFDIICLNTNYHVEHHDFPSIPLLSLHRIKEIAPEFYGPDAVKSGTNLWDTIKEVFEHPQFYSCTGVSADGLRLASLAAATT